MWRTCSQSQRSRQGETEGFAGGSAGFEGPGPEGVGGVLDDGAADVEGVHEIVAGEAGEFLGAGGFLLGFFFAAVGGEEIFEGGDLFGLFVAGEGVSLGASNQGCGALEEGGAAGIEAGADEVAVGCEVGVRIAVFGEHLVFLFGGALDGLEAGEEGCGGFGALEGGGGGFFGIDPGFGGAAASLGDDVGKTGEVGCVDIAVLDGGGIGEGGGFDVFGQLDVIELGLVEVAAGGGFLGR